MTGHFTLDWAVMAVSLFNTILLLWLGLTVLLNVERRPAEQGPRRRWAIWLAGGGLLTGGAFFISHSAILGHGLNYVSQGMDFWWHVGWIPVAALPFVWYAVMLWYTGFWDERGAALRHRHRLGLRLTVLLSIGLMGLLLFANPLPSYWQVVQLNLSATPALGGIPLLLLIYPIYVVLCLGLSLDALRRPEPAGRAMGDGAIEFTQVLARRRAHPWLMAAAVALLLVGLLVAWVMFWIVLNARRQTLYQATASAALAVAGFDLVIASLIAVATVALGQAIVSYEVFTGKTLPRRGLRRYWRNAIILAAGYGVVVGWSLTFRLRAIYSLLLTTILMTLFYALSSWRAYAERERYIAHLRPFVTSQRLYEQLLSASGPAETATMPPPGSVTEWIDVTTPFRALCRDVLGARVAYLVALGPLAPLAGPPLAYPDDAPASLPSLTEVTAQFHSPQTMCVLLDPPASGAMPGVQVQAAPGNSSPPQAVVWAVPLWSERGLIGVLLLGEKQDGGLYTQEEIEIARASGERLVDTQASAEMARRLMALQRQRMAESQIVDRRTRRALHDDVLPRLHTALLALGSDVPSAEAVTLLTDVHRQISNLLRERPSSTAPQVARLGLFSALRQAVDEELGDAFDRVTWRVEPEAEREARSIPWLTAEVLFYAAREAIRNAACHGRDAESTRSLYLDLFATQRDGLQIFIEDNGVGIEAARLSADGDGQGLALHGTMMAVVGGSLAVESVPGAYTRVTLALPPTAAGWPPTADALAPAEAHC